MSTSLSKDIPPKMTDGVRIELVHVPGGHVNLAINNPKKRAGRKKFHETRHRVLRGIRCRDNDKWVCEVRQPNDKSRMAAQAHDVGAIALWSPLACLNFEESLWLFPIPTSMDPKDIDQ